MVGSLGVKVYFEEHACLAAYMHILRKIWILRASPVKSWHVISRQLIHSAYGIADVGGFWSKLPIEVEIKTTKEVVSNRTHRVRWTVRHSTGQVTWEQARRLVQS